MSFTSPTRTHRESLTSPTDRMETTRRTGVFALGLLILLFLVTDLLQAAVGYPKIYIEKPAVWYVTFAHGGLSLSLLPWDTASVWATDRCRVAPLIRVPPKKSGWMAHPHFA